MTQDTPFEKIGRMLSPNEQEEEEEEVEEFETEEEEETDVEQGTPKE
jgi:hypothetical protein